MGPGAPGDFIETLRARPPVADLLLEKSWPCSVGNDALTYFPKSYVPGRAHRVAAERSGPREDPPRDVILACSGSRGSLRLVGGAPGGLPRAPRYAPPQPSGSAGVS